MPGFEAAAGADANSRARQADDLVVVGSHFYGNSEQAVGPAYRGFAQFADISLDGQITKSTKDAFALGVACSCL